MKKMCVKIMYPTSFSFSKFITFRSSRSSNLACHSDTTYFDIRFRISLCMTLSEQILVANCTALEPSAPHANVSRHIFHFHTIQHGEQRFGKFRKCESHMKLQPSLLKITSQVIPRPQLQAAVSVLTQHRHM